MQKAMSFNHIAIVSIKGNYYRIQFWYTSKAEAISLFEKNPDLSGRSWILLIIIFPLFYLKDG